jgi:hypothetical protein
MTQTDAILEVVGELIQELSYSIYDIFVYASANYFRFTILSFLIFWVLFGQKLAHFRIQPKRRTKTKVILKEVGFSLLTFGVIGTINWF